MADGIEVTKVTIDENAIREKLNSVIHKDDLMWHVHETYAYTVKPWVPYDTGYLCGDADASAVEITSHAVVYHADYAAVNYYGTEIHHKREHHPLASAYWDKVAMQTEKDSFTQKVKELIVLELQREQRGGNWISG